MPNDRESIVARRYQALGYKALRGGAPDFLMLKVENGVIQEVLAVEVKKKGKHLTYEQALYRDLLSRAGIKYIMEEEK